MDEIENKIEAVLFITGKFMSIDDISSFCNIASQGSVRQAMKRLRKRYEGQTGALRITEEDGKFKLNIKKSYNHLSTKLISAAELDKPTQATLAIIAYKQPALQSEIIKIRGSTAYDHIKTLKEMEFITSERKGRTRLLKLAPKFFDYFDVVQDTLEKQFEKIAKEQEEKLEDQKQKVAENVEDNSKAPIYDELTQEKEKPEEKETEPEAEKKPKEKTRPAKVVVEIKADHVEEEETEEVERTPSEVLLNLDADDFGS